MEEKRVENLLLKRSKPHDGRFRDRLNNNLNDVQANECV